MAREFGAEGIGLCRTEHMFFQADRIDFFRQMILLDDIEERKEVLAKLIPIQRDDFWASSGRWKVSQLLSGS
ncbi:MAG: putative PEP-binding protein [Dehalococcoidia bacterium]